MAKVMIWRANKEDLPKLRDLEGAFFAEAAMTNDRGRNSNFPLTDAGKAYLASFVTTPNRVAFVVEAEQAVGYVSAEITDDNGTREAPYCKIHELFIVPDFRRQEIGTALYQQVVDWGRNNKAAAIRLNVYDENASAQKFYAKHGFKPKYHNLEHAFDA